ncbi:hypothetical protein SPHINGO391_510085 [Sphingomonas aurantiaca]|uniref:Uncharacterized protein n=1 Tax=Sphingomonas aurantiaca TaxID=185949 RepID=A0A5E8ACQ8_9SPHN|nr:hypothetical protein SPHINGO391_510085 [Sphingomonas aurantiaca]
MTLPEPSAGSASWRESNDYLSTRTTAPTDLDVLLTLFSDSATRMTFRAAAGDTSRGRSCGEWRTRIAATRSKPTTSLQSCLCR